MVEVLNRSCRFISAVGVPCIGKTRIGANGALPFLARPYVPPFHQNHSLTFKAYMNQEGSTMFKAKYVGFVLLTGLFLGAGSTAYGEESPKPIKSLYPVTSSKVEGVSWVRLCISQYPEILWLADENVRKTEEGNATLKGSYSEQLFGKKFIEFDRTIMTLHCLRLILEGTDKAYIEFTKAQPKDGKLSRKSFDLLHEQAVSLFTSLSPDLSESEVIKAMEASLVLGDIGKSEKAREVFKPYGASAPDHDDFHEEVIQILQTHPELCPTFDKLSPAVKKLITQTSNLAHYGHITHIEGGPSMFSKLKESGLPKTSPAAFLFDYFVHTCDVAGALGHVNNQSSLMYLEETHLALQSTLEACKVLEGENQTEIDAYDAYLSIRANLLGLNSKDRLDRALVKVGCMLRLFTREEGVLLKEAMSKLSLEIQAQIIKELDTQEGEELERTPTYMPAVLVNLSNHPNLGNTKAERITQAVLLGLPFIARVLETHKEHIVHFKADPAIPLNFNQAAGVAKTNPAALNGEYRIDLQGNVSV